MALGGIGNEGAASMLERFQQARDVARRKLDGDDGKARLAGLLQKKKDELGLGSLQAQAPGAQRAAHARQTAPAFPFGDAGGRIKGPAAALGASAYGRVQGADRPDPRPALGRHIDLTA